MSKGKVATSKLPLAGVTILELAGNIAGPMATLILADQGANIIKVEPPDGDPLRLVGTRKGDTSAFFSNANRGKRSVAINLKSAAGQKIVQTLATKADVLIHNYRPGVMKRLNLDSDRLRADNPRLIYVDVTGFGQTGPMKNLPAYDNVVQALLGYTEIQAVGGEREFMKTTICDKATAYTAAQAITAALLARGQTGEGQHIDISMLEASLYYIWPDGMINHTFLADYVEKLPPIGSFLKKYVTLDGEVIATPRTDEHWKAIFTLMGEPKLIDDPRFCSLVARADNIGPLYKKLSEGLKHVKTADAVSYLREHDVTCIALQSIDEAIEDPQVTALGAVQKRDHQVLGPMNIAMPPVRFEGEQCDAAHDSPIIGQHTLEILGEFGYEARTIQDLAEDGTLIVAERSET